METSLGWFKFTHRQASCTEEMRKKDLGRSKFLPLNQTDWAKFDLKITIFTNWTTNSSITIYYMSLFFEPNNIIYSIEKLFRDFHWREQTISVVVILWTGGRNNQWIGRFVIGNFKQRTKNFLQSGCGDFMWKKKPLKECRGDKIWLHQVKIMDRGTFLLTLQRPQKSIIKYHYVRSLSYPRPRSSVDSGLTTSL